MSASQVHWLLAGVLGVAVITMTTAIAAAFVWPSGDDAVYDLGRLEDFPPGSVTTYELRGDRLLPGVSRSVPGENVFHVARLEDGELVAFQGETTHSRDCIVIWDPQRM